MKTLSEVVLAVGRADRVEITRWVDLGWVAPVGRRGAEPAFSDLDIARLCLICDLRHDLDVDEETMPLVLSLLDQIYTLRRQLSALTDALRQQPDDIRRAILDRLPKAREGHGGEREKRR
ncbi:MAG TPA: chaperone modulator CbpM, partial [Geminicoccaceae bacterium]|nr:chaperone modulator CbpM [Geminicoccaceae bacterium]